MPIHDWTRVDAGIFHNFHLLWTAELLRAINRRLPPGYYALAEQRVAGSGEPDVLALQFRTFDGPPSNGHHASVNGDGNGGGIALADAPPQVRFHDQTDADAYHRLARQVVVRHVSGDRVVAVVEVVSPGNKWSQNAFDAFTDKAVGLLRAGVHLLRLDLHPPTPRDPEGIHPAVWSAFVDRPFALPAGKPLTLVAYAAGWPKEAFVDPVGVGDPLPDMPLFLTPGVYVPVPLDATYQAAWADVPPRWRDVIAPPAGCP